ncbi:MULTISPECIES: DUF378 domain-containing protein [Lysinibacillus]|uniref:DUF378 domain-containing protein n=1 Tax=Lysinibacillus antri TaxID=2498145 RepID=A0A432L8B4_9BACI|nr:MULTISPECIES: DUF378 domain-containing protein [Lysinibacillus]RUL48693.1 DUF378 domain-containing protein [Lysinibacillus antri]TSI08688.1 DUF378 domain-containing protein [Lysinibacillus sp. BW-2-10]
MGLVYRLALVLVIIGAINWGLIGLFQFNLVAALFGENSALSRIVYSLVGLSGLLTIPLLFKAFEEEDVVVEETRHSNAFTNTNYQTEFGEEADFSEVQKEHSQETNSEDKNNMV